MRRPPAIAALGGAVALAGLVLLALLALLGGGDTYRVTARFQSASQLVAGNEVVIAGTPVGAIERIELDDNGEALVTFSVDPELAPLRRGTIATARSFSLAGVANRQLELTLPRGASAGEEIPNGGELSGAETVSEVDLDQILNTLDEPTVEDLKRVIGGLERSYEGVEHEANRGARYLNPLLSRSRRVLGELRRDERAFEGLLVDGSRLSGALAARNPDISRLVDKLDTAMGAIGAERDALARGISRLPDFLRRFNSTAFNVRAALDDLDPLVSAARPVAARMRPFFAEFRHAAADLAPATRDLDAIVKRGGSLNDLVEVTRLQEPLAEIATGPVRRTGASRRGALPESVEALEGSLPILAYLRAYTPDLVGWFNDFSTSGLADANGGLGRTTGVRTPFAASTPGFAEIFGAPLNPHQRIAGLQLDVLRRCPGSLERDPGDGSTPFTDGGSLECDPSQIPVGP